MKKLLFILILFFSTTNAWAVGIYVKPAELNIKATSGREASSRIKVKNPSNEVALFEVYPEEFENQITVSPAKFMLESGAEREVLVKFKSDQEGVIDTRLAAVSRPPDNPEGVGGGAKINLQIENRKSDSFLADISAMLNPQNTLYALLVVIMGYVVISVARRYIRT